MVDHCFLPSGYLSLTVVCLLPSVFDYPLTEWQTAYWNGQLPALRKLPRYQIYFEGIDRPARKFPFQLYVLLYAKLQKACVFLSVIYPLIFKRL